METDRLYDPFVFVRFRFNYEVGYFRDLCDLSGYLDYFDFGNFGNFDNFDYLDYFGLPFE